MSEILLKDSINLMSCLSLVLKENDLRISSNFSRAIAFFIRRFSTNVSLSGYVHFYARTQLFLSFRILYLVFSSDSMILTQFSFMKTPIV
jgi:hypothetical protein